MVAGETEPLLNGRHRQLLETFRKLGETIDVRVLLVEDDQRLASSLSPRVPSRL